MYEDKEQKELLALLGRHKELTFQSQLYLRDELAKRGLLQETGDLNGTISKKETEIKNFIYLKDLGFQAERREGSIKVTRTTKAVLTDIAAVVLGFLLPFLGFRGILELVTASQDGSGLGFSTVIMGIVYGAMIYIGLKFLSGIKRLFDFAGFELSRNAGKITMKKRLDLKLEEITADPSSLKLEKIRDLMVLKLDGYRVLSCSANTITQKMTIEALYEELRKP